ncbi:hypothetical protein ZOSMA_306G00100 [Zostera marina]|uniref:Uncharacterized protein n=1 Tax=Zostera marina TaxID=29655 RepID=A0A0K9PCF5_ZOSMR|nr:hypothetical protein ZOSMA_306G00100 [Zostera marina]
MFFITLLRQTMESKPIPISSYESEISRVVLSNDTSNALLSDAPSEVSLVIISSDSSATPSLDNGIYLHSFSLSSESIHDSSSSSSSSTSSVQSGIPQSQDSSFPYPRTPSSGVRIPVTPLNISDTCTYSSSTSFVNQYNLPDVVIPGFITDSSSNERLTTPPPDDISADLATLSEWLPTLNEMDIQSMMHYGSSYNYMTSTPLYHPIHPPVPVYWELVYTSHPFPFIVFTLNFIHYFTDQRLINCFLLYLSQMNNRRY